MNSEIRKGNFTDESAPSIKKRKSPSLSTPYAELVRIPVTPLKKTNDAAVPSAALDESKPKNLAPDVVRLQDPIIHPQDSVPHSLSLGRDEKNDVRLYDARFPNVASRFHALIEIDENGVHSVIDRGSSFGTYVDDVLIPTETPYPLRSGSIVWFGGSNILVEANGEKTYGGVFRYAYHKIRSVESWKRMTSGKGARPPLPEWLAEETLKCPVCSDYMDDPHSIDGCGHVFCRDCLSRTFCEKRSCPTCRQEVGEKGNGHHAITPCLATRDLIDRLVHPYLTVEEVREREETSRANRDQTIKKRKTELSTNDGGFFSRPEIGEQYRLYVGRRLDHALETRADPRSRAAFLSEMSQGIVRRLNERERQREGPADPWTRRSQEARTRLRPHALSLLHQEVVFRTQALREVPAPTLPRASWELLGVDSAATATAARRETRCATCEGVLPEGCFRLSRTRGNVTHHLHVSYKCALPYATEFRNAETRPVEKGVVDKQQKAVAAHLYRCLEMSAKS